MTEAVAVPTQGFAVPPASPGTVQHSRETGTPAPQPAYAPDVAPQTQAPTEAQPAPAHEPQSPQDFREGQPIVPALDPRLTELLRQEAARKEPVDPEAVKRPEAATAPEPPKFEGGLNDLDPASIDDPQLRTLGELLIASAPDLDIERALGKAIEYMDPNLIDTHYINEVGGERGKALSSLAEQIVNVAKVQGEATVNAIYEGAGGQENWNAAVALFNKNAPLHMRQVAAELLDSKNFGKIKSGAQFVLEYAKQQGGMVQHPNQHQRPSAGPGNAAQALSKADFQKALNELAPEHVNPDYVNQRAALYARRQLGKNLGI